MDEFTNCGDMHKFLNTQQKCNDKLIIFVVVIIILLGFKIINCINIRLNIMY